MSANDKACVGCRWFRGGECRSLKTVFWRASRSRSADHDCGPEARYYEPREKDDASA